MTSDMKLGLLLALVLIVSIVFVIEGLPGLRTSENKWVTEGDEPIRIDNLSAGLISKARDVADMVDNSRRANQNSSAANHDNNGSTNVPRDVQPLPVAKRPGADKPIAIEQPAMAHLIFQSSGSAKKVYIVQQGDNLAEIAKKFYGEETGNKREVVKKLFEANNSELKSPDQIRVGQKIIIPPLAQSGMFEVVKDFNPASTGPRKSKTLKTRYHVVGEDETLWEISEKYLGSGSRYDEIIKLNRDKIENANQILKGMKLKLPG